MSPGKRPLRTLRRLLTPGGDVTDRTISSGAWVALYNLVDRFLQLGTILFLAGFLGPVAFGLFGIALVTHSGLKRLTRLGLDTALIQHRDDDIDTYLDTVWTVELARGVLLGALLCLSAPLVSLFFGEPRVADILRVFALFPVIKGLRNPGIVYFVKDLDFHKDIGYKLSGRVVFVLIGVWVGYTTRSVWALVFAIVAAQFTSLVVSYLIHPYRPWLRFDRAAASELFSYGKWIFGSEGLMFLINEGDDLFVGWALGTSALGIYQLSYRFSNAPATEITHPIQRVLFPAYSKIQDDPASLRGGYFTTVRVITLLSFPVSVGIVVVSPVFVSAILGSAWSGMVVPMQLFATYAALRSFRSATVPLFRAINRPDYDTKVRILKLALIVPFIFPAAQAFGITGVALVILGHTLIAAPIASYIAVRSIDGKLSTFGKILSYPTFGSIIMGVVVYTARERIDGVPLGIELVFLVLFGIFTYIAIMLGLERRFGVGLGHIYRLFRNGVH